MAKPVIATGDVPPAATWNSWFVNVNWARTTGNQTVTNSTTLITSAELVVPVEANAIYIVNCHLNYTGPSAADLKVLFRTPTSGSFSGHGDILNVGAASQSDKQALPYGGNASESWGTL